MFHLQDELSDFTPFFTEFLEKKQKTGTKIECDMLGCIPLIG